MILESDRFQIAQRNSRLYQATEEPISSTKGLIVNSFGDVKNVTTGEIIPGKARQTETRPQFDDSRIGKITIDDKVELLFVGDFNKQKTAPAAAEQNIPESEPTLELSERPERSEKPAFEFADWEDVDFEQSLELAQILEMLKTSSFLDIASYFPYDLTVRDLEGKIHHCWTNKHDRGGQTFDIKQLMRDGFLEAITSHRLLDFRLEEATARYFAQTLTGATKEVENISDPLFLHFGPVKDNPEHFQVSLTCKQSDSGFMKNGEPRPGSGMPLTVSFEASQQVLVELLTCIERNPQVLVELIKCIFPQTVDRNISGTSFPTDLKVSPSEKSKIPPVVPEKTMPATSIVNTSFRNSPPQVLYLLPLLTPDDSDPPTCLVNNRQYSPYTDSADYSVAQNASRRERAEKYKYEVDSNLIGKIPLTGN